MTIAVYDRYGVQRDWDWLVEHYGPLVVHPANPGPGWRVIALYENADTTMVQGVKSRVGAFINLAQETIDKAAGINAGAVIVVKCLDKNGQPVSGVRVAWYWPDAPEDPNAGPVNGLPSGMRPGRALFGPTNDNGDVGFGMGGGAYYWPPGIGPHATWVYGANTNSDVVFGLGMVAQTNHNSWWPVLQWTDEPEGDCPKAEILAEMNQMEAAVLEIAQSIATVRGLLT